MHIFATTKYYVKILTVGFNFPFTSLFFLSFFYQNDMLLLLNSSVDRGRRGRVLFHTQGGKESPP